MTEKRNIQPVFLAASVRSGSTLLGLMLNSHPDIVDPGECDFLFDQVADDGTPPDVGRYTEWLKLNRIFISKQLDVDPSMDFAGLIASFVTQMQKGNTAIVMNVHHNFHRIPKVFPHAKYIHLVRDGRDVARSCIGMNWVGNVYYGIDIWRDAESAWDMLKVNLHPSQYLEIKYEDLLGDIELGLGRICQFLELTYSKNMLDYATKSTYSLPDKSLCYQWRSKYSERELSLVENKVGNMLVKLGYELSGVPARGPNLFEQTKLYLQNKYYRASKEISVYGFHIYIQYLFARKLRITSWERSLKTRRNAAEIKILK